ncbi:MAG: mannitol transporter, partial [bacterium]|nr:mannitol transporter [bacterium]
RCWLNPDLGPILSEEDQPKTSAFYGAEVALICLGVLTVCRVFGLAMGGAFGGVMPFGGLIVLAITCAVTYAAYRRLNILKIVLPITVIFHFYMIFVNMGEDGSLPTWSITFAAFILLLAYLGRPIYSAAADSGFHFSDLWDEFFAGLMPPTILISFALGSILLGLATP